MRSAGQAPGGVPAPARRLPSARAILAAGLLGAGLGWTGLVAGCAGPPPPPAADGRPPVILISLDTLRADAVGRHPGRGRSLTPHLDALARDGVVFRRALAPMPFTLPSHMSIFTGLYPGAHGVTRRRDRLAEGIPTLPALFHDAGYQTVGWVTSEWLKGEFGFGRGFDRYRRLPTRLTYADRVDDAALSTLQEAGSRPLFLFLHYMDAHSDFASRSWLHRNTLPYFAPEGFRPRADRALPDDAFCDPEGRCATAFLQAADREGRALPPQTVAAVRGLYDAGVRALDADLGRLFDALRRTDLYRRSLIVVTSDHGEEFREHGRFLHSQPYAESLSVPLILKLPDNRGAGTRVTAQVELTDLLPTLLEAAGIPPPSPIRGRSLLPLLGGGPPPHRTALGQDKVERSRFALRTARFTFLCDLDSGHRELFDRRRDPGERHDLAAADPERAGRLYRRLKGLVGRTRELAVRLGTAGKRGDDEVLTEEERNQLEALGYVE